MNLKSSLSLKNQPSSVVAILRSGGSVESVAARMVSETAQDLRSPLTVVREAIRLVGDGSLGQVNDDQHACLSAAIDQCNCMDQMIGEMVQLERLRTGSPRANRSWVEINSVRVAVDEVLRSWTTPHQIEVLWDIGNEGSKVIFADASMLRRMIVNLATNAIRASKPGGLVLIRLQRTQADEMIRWSIIDQGNGMAEQEMHRIIDRDRSVGGDDGVGLSICRQLAAVHFSALQIRSRSGYGTEVSFQTPAMGPRSVASAWARWRVAARGPLQKPSRRSGAMSSNATVRRLDGDAHVRLDPPSIAVELSHDTVKPRCDDRLAAGTVTLGAAVSRQAADDFDRLLQSQLQMFELVYRTDTRRWVWVFDVDTHGIEDRIAMIGDSANETIGGVRTAWSTPQMIPIDDRRTASRLSDLMVRESLAASTSSRVLDQDTVRLGSSPIVPNGTAELRLDAELRHLATQMKTQSARLRQQAQNLRPQA